MVRSSKRMMIDWLGSTSARYRIVLELEEKGVSFKVLDDPSIDTASRTDKRLWASLPSLPSSQMTFGESARWMASPRDRGVKFGRERELTDARVEEIRALRESGETVPANIKRTGLSKASIGNGG